MESSEESKEHVHRSKSKLAKSLLGRSKHDRHTDDETDTKASSSYQSSAAGSKVSLTPSQQPTPPRSSINLQSKRISKHRPHLSTTMSNAGGLEGAPSSALSNSPGVTSPPSPTATSLEQSVKLFRLFEALRAGDTAAIQKALKEQPSQDSEANQARTSTSSINTPVGRVEGTTILHLAIQCAELPIIQYVLSHSALGSVNARDREGNTALHVAAKLGRGPVVGLLLEQEGINDSITNYHGQTPLDVSYTPEIFQQLQLFRSLVVDANVRKIHDLIASGDHETLERLLKDPRTRSTVDVNGGELATDPTTIQSGGTLLHEAARKKDVKLIQMLLLNGADPFRRDRKGKLPQDVTKDDRTRAILKKSPAAAEARQGIQEKSILGGGPAQAGGVAPSDNPISNKDGREMQGYLKKWTNYTGGWKLRWFVLEDGVLSYYKHQDDAGAACRGAINMRIAKLNMDPQDKLKFEILGKSSVKYHLKANHEVEAKRWYWALNNAIQFTKDEAREDEKRQKTESEALRQAKMEQMEKLKAGDSDNASLQSSKPKHLVPGTAFGVPLTSTHSATSTAVDDPSFYDPSVAGADLSRMVSSAHTATIAGDVDDDEEYGDDASSHEAQPETKDALNITAQSVKLQLEFLGQVSQALQAERQKNPSLQLSDPNLGQALATYESSVGNLKDLVGKLLQISRDRDAYWQYRLDREANVRRMWEESMAKVAIEQEELEQKIGESEDKRKRTKRALRDALGSLAVAESQPNTPARERDQYVEAEEEMDRVLASPKRRPTIADLTGVPDSDSEDDDEFFDAVGAGDVEVVNQMPPTSPGLKPVEQPMDLRSLRERKAAEISSAFKGYEDPIRKKLAMDADNRPKIGLWGILKSMIGKDMTKMTLPVSFNEPTSLLQRVAEDMEYTDLLDTAAERLDSTERMVYVAAFAASEYASTIGRVAKPFNPLLGETYEYARPDKGYRFFIEQVSHHPPIGAAYAESPKWDYYGESAVKSKFYGKSFDINPLGTWFLRLRPSNGGEELYTWKKVTSSVIGIITGNPTVDNYGIMEVKNHTTGEVCTLDFKARGWKASSAFQVAGRVCDADGKTRWSVGGRWNDKIYARLTPGYEDNTFDSAKPSHSTHSGSGRNDTMSSSQAFLVWQANPRPTGIPFNLTPFVLTLNALPDSLRPHLAPTDTRLRPDQRAMEDGEYDFAATEKNRVEEKQRARRRVREQMGEEFVPRWFEKSVCETTGEEFWRFNGGYWRERGAVGEGRGTWDGCEDIF
ncbi:oxysterol-binding protein [Tothia fuscella]|uniref:Oxysterol-binding protein n=1 Tax=Tothia fuscella TaxID=1048955 RepID=A0A9P4TZG1_9PEZI|nr:oxysterol-binding protein [Tothia fuscella]